MLVSTSSKTAPKSRFRPKNKKAPDSRTIHGIKLYRCSNFKAWIQPSQCDVNRVLGQKALDTAFHKLQLINMASIETSESRIDCVDCPGVVERCRRESRGQAT